MITNPEIRSKLKNNKLVNKDKKELLFLYNASLNKKKEKEKYSNLRNIQISNFDLNSEKSEYTNENLNQKLNSSRNYLFRTYKNNFCSFDSSNNSSKINTERIFNFKTAFNTSNKPKLILRKYELELNKIMNKKENNKLINLKTFGNKSNTKQIRNNFNNIKSIDINNKEIQSKSAKYKSKKNQKLIKKNFSGKNFEPILRKIIYFNQKNDIISKKHIINLIQNEENSLNILKTKRKRNKNIDSKKKCLSGKNLIRINQQLLTNPINKTKSEMNLFQKTDYLYNNKLKLKNIKKNINLKANYNEEYDLFENEYNYDNYIEEKEYSSLINFFKNIYESDNIKTGNKENLNQLRNFNSFSYLQNFNNFPMKNNFVKKINKTIEQEDNKKEIIKRRWTSEFNDKRFSFTKFNNTARKRKSIIEGYLLNYNIKSDKYFDAILNYRNNKQLNLKAENEEGSKEYISGFEDILNEKKKARNSYHNYLFESFENKIDSNPRKSNLELDFSTNSSKPKGNKLFYNDKKIEINEKNKNQKLNEKKLSKMNVIYEEIEQEKNNNNENGFTYFSPNNKRIGNINTEKNKDIVKYLSNSEYEKPQENKDNKENKDIKKNIKNNYINKNNSERKLFFNNKINLNKKISNNFGLNKYNYSRNNISSLKKTKALNTLTKTKENINDKTNSNEISEKEEEKDIIENKVIENRKSIHDINKNKRKSIALNNDITINELAILDKKTIDIKEKFNMIKEYKDKAIFKVFSIVNKILKENPQLQMNIENLIKFMIINDFKKYINILQILIEKERALSNFSKSEKVKDEEIIKYIHRIFSDQYSPYYIKTKKLENPTINISNDQSIYLHLSTLLKENSGNILSHKRFLSFSKNEENNQENQENERKNDEKEIKPKPKFKLKKKSIENRKTIKQFLKENFEDKEKQKMDFLKQKLSLTNELKYQIQITQEEEGKRRFQFLLEQIETLKNDDILEYIKFVHEKYGNYKNEIQKLVNAREKEHRINYFINELIDERDSIEKLKKIRNVSFEDYKI